MQLFGRLGDEDGPLNCRWCDCVWAVNGLSVFAASSDSGWDRDGRRRALVVLACLHGWSAVSGRVSSRPRSSVRCRRRRRGAVSPLSWPSHHDCPSWTQVAYAL